MARQGRLRRLHRGVYLVGPVEGGLTRESAAVLACEPSALLSHMPAVSLWALGVAPRRPARIDVTVVGRDPGLKPGISIHRIVSIGRDEIRRRRGIPVTSPARTILDVAPRLPAAALEGIIADALHRPLLRPAHLSSLLGRYPSRPGVPAIRALLESDGGPAFTRSEAEKRFLGLLRDSGLPAPEANVPIGPYEVDFLWREDRLVVEVDSWRFHGDRRAFERDRARDADLVSRGFRVIRVTWRQVTDDPQAVVARVAAALRAT